MAKRWAATGPIEGLWALPDGWRWERLGEVAQVIAGQSPPSALVNKHGEGLPFFQGKAEFGSDQPTARNWCSKPTKIAESGDVLISVRAPVGPTNYAPERCGIGRGLAAIRSNAVSRRYLRYWLAATGHILREKATGTTFEAITGDVLRHHVVPMPPSGSDEAIVARIDELFAEIDDAEAALARARDDLATWRKALLKAAVTGELTADWRAANSPTETGVDLLARILVERRATPKKKRMRDAEKSESNPNADRPLPDGWARCSPNQIVEWSSGKFMPDRSMNGGDVPVYGGNGIAGYHDEALVDERTLVIGRVGHYCGNAYATAGAAWISDNAIYASQVAAGVAVEYLRLVFEQVNLRRMAQGGAQPFVSQTLLNSIPIPLPSSDEQVVILEAVRQGLAEAKNLHLFTEEADVGSATLRQSILAAAFRGELA